MIHIIIPVFNEERILLEKKDYFQDLKKNAGIIFADGGSSDRTVEIARNYGEVVCCRRGRGIQKNRGAEFAKGEKLLFMHVDTCIDSEALEKINHALSNGICGGCLTLAVDDHRWIFRLFERIVNFRAKYFHVIDGDLGLFVKKSIFNKAGRFDPIAMTEDILFSRKLRAQGKVVALSPLIIASSRKWRQEGFLKTFLGYTSAYFQIWKKQL